MSGCTAEIPRGDWTSRLHEFSAVHRGWLIDVEYESPSLGAQLEFLKVPLISVSYESDGTGAIRLCAGRSPSDHIAHVFDAPRRVWIERTAEGADVALAIESSDGSQTIVKFQTPALPETVDGVAEWP